MKQFMSNVVDEFNPVVQVEHSLQLFVSPLKLLIISTFTHGSAQGVKDAIADFVTSPNQRTSIGKGLKKIQDDYFLSANGGKRQCAKEFVILRTDGKHNEGDPFPVPIAQELKDENVTIITVGIGSGTDDAELEAIASPGFKFDVANFSALSDEMDANVQTACAAVECTSQTGGDNPNLIKTKKDRYVKDDKILNISVPVYLYLSPKQLYGSGSKNPYVVRRTESPSQDGIKRSRIEAKFFLYSSSLAKLDK